MTRSDNLNIYIYQTPSRCKSKKVPPMAPEKKRKSVYSISDVEKKKYIN